MPYICGMEKVKQKVGRSKVPENQRKKLVSAYLTDDEKKLILDEFGSLSHAVRVALLPRLVKKTTPDGHHLSYWD